MSDDDDDPPGGGGVDDRGGDGGGGGGGGADDANEQPARAIQRRPPFQDNVTLEPSNLRPNFNNAAKNAEYQQFLATRSANQMISIETLSSNPNASYRSNIMVAMLLTITVNRSQDKRGFTTGRGGPNGQRGNTNSTHYTRMYRLFDPLASEGHNVFVILEGKGNSEGLFTDDPLIRDDGTICKWFVLKKRCVFLISLVTIEHFIFDRFNSLF
jgi:hypothetical protein